MWWKRIIWLPVLSWYVFNPYLSPDSYWYLTAAQAIRTNTWQENYVWNRTPGYPLLIAIVNSFSPFNALYVISVVQVLMTLLSVAAFTRILKTNEPIEARRQLIGRLILSAWVLCFMLYGGYLSSILQQCLIFNALIWTIIFTVKVFRRQFSSSKELVYICLLIVIEFFIHPLCAFVLSLTYISVVFARINTNRSSLRSTGHFKRLIIHSLIPILVLTMTGISWMSISSSMARDQVATRSIDLANNVSSSYSAIGPDGQSPSYLVTDPNFVVSIGQPLIKNPIDRLSSLPKNVFVNLIDFPLNGPSIHIGFFRIFSSKQHCVIPPSIVILNVYPGLLKGLPASCQQSIPNQLDFLNDFLAPIIYYSAYILVFFLLAVSLIIVYRSGTLLRIMYLPPIAFVLTYSLLGAHENRYGAPATSILCILGICGLSRSRDEGIEVYEDRRW